MRDLPSGDNLLAVARDVLRQQLLPALPADKQYLALMVANAMSIAERQLQAADRFINAEHIELTQLLGKDIPLAELNLQFAQGIRKGEFDQNPQAQKLLWCQTVQRVRESAPKALAAYGI